jgi:peptide/nickel transport system ATP-binding protein
MMARLREQENLSILYITHDLASARYIADRILVMYAGHLVESGPAETILSAPKHPYTQLLLSSVPEVGAQISEPSGDTGEPPKVINPGEGCRFRSRCPYKIDQCERVTPQLRPMGPTHQAACHVATPDAEESGGSPAIGSEQDGSAVAPISSELSTRAAERNE